MLYLGLDVHSKWTSIRGFNPETGEVVSFSKVRNDPESIMAALSELEGPLYGAMEVGTNAWAMYWTLLEFFEELIVVDALRTWGTVGRRGAKTDKRDAMGLAQRLYHGQLVSLYVPDEQTQDYRVLIRGRIHTTRRKTALVNEIGSLLRSWGQILEKSLLTVEGRAFAESCRERLPENSLLVFDSLVKQLDLVVEEEAKLGKRIEEIAKQEETCKVLKTIPDVGWLTAFAVRAEVGDIRRFASSKHLVSYCGLAPGVEQSGDRCRRGELPVACNKILRYVLMLRGSEYARTDKRSNPMRKACLRAALRGHVNDGKVNAARKLVRVMYAMMKYHEPWNPAKAARVA